MHGTVNDDNDDAKPPPFMSSYPSPELYFDHIIGRSHHSPFGSSPSFHASAVNEVSQAIPQYQQHLLPMLRTKDEILFSSAEERDAFIARQNMLRRSLGWSPIEAGQDDPLRSVRADARSSLAEEAVLIQDAYTTSEKSPRRPKRASVSSSNKTSTGASSEDGSQRGSKNQDFAVEKRPGTQSRKSAGKDDSQLFFKGFPERHIAAPGGLTCYEVCQQYPNSLDKEGLDAFLQQNWSGQDMWGCLPESIRNAVLARQTKNPWGFLTKRLSHRKKALVDSREWEDLHHDAINDTYVREDGRPDDIGRWKSTRLMESMKEVIAIGKSRAHRYSGRTPPPAKRRRVTSKYF